MNAPTSSSSRGVSPPIRRSRRETRTRYDNKPLGEEAVNGSLAVAIPAADLRLNGVDSFVELMASGRELELKAPESFEDLAHLVVGDAGDPGEVGRRKSTIETLHQRHGNRTRCADVDWAATGRLTRGSRRVSQQIRQVEQQGLRRFGLDITRPPTNLVTDDVKTALRDPANQGDVAFDFRTLDPEVTQVRQRPRRQTLQGVRAEQTRKGFDHRLQR